MTLQGDGAPKIGRSPNGRVRRIAGVALPTTAALGAGAALAFGAIPGADGSVVFCYAPGVEADGPARIVDSAGDCDDNESSVTLNQKGPAGPAGPQGPQGPQGPAGSGGGSGLAYPPVSSSASNFLLEIDGIKGESTDSKLKDSIDVQSWSFGAENSGGAAKGSGAGAGKVSFGDFQVVKKIDKASPALLKAVATGQHLKSVVLHVRKAGRTAAGVPDRQAE